MKILYLVLGLISFLIGIIGIVLPIIPTTPFMLLTSFCLLKSSDSLNEKFQRTKFYEEHVKPLKENRGMTMKSKMIILTPVTIMLSLIIVLIENTIMRGVIVVILIVKIVVFTKIKTLKEEVETNDKQKITITK
ncbi:YbaN family protein [Oceanirhabdus sp. W0125-5]|uniref:YbaN family protein n=1 Tax=Oceanirhabdus sp. W0125-5 TaxID=2999116 RepID=UPI0022F302DB|nr:YbaN family protein [Oceanirhabdus sp. W0125-5]WBW95058.1 YbaN family protein [Oceanirhabdus sp. W0125-5]